MMNLLPTMDEKSLIKYVKWEFIGDFQTLFFEAQGRRVFTIFFAIVSVILGKSDLVF